MKKYLPLQWRTLQGIHKKGIAFWEAKVKDNVAGVGSRHSLMKKCVNLKLSHGACTASGARAPGAGRHDHFKHFKVALKTWVQLERESGHAIDGHDMV